MKITKEHLLIVGLITVYVVGILAYDRHLYLYDSRDVWLTFDSPTEATHYSKHYQARTMMEAQLHDVVWTEEIPENRSFVIRAQNGLEIIAFDFNFYYYNETSDDYRIIGEKIITFNLTEWGQPEYKTKRIPT